MKSQIVGLSIEEFKMTQQTSVRCTAFDGFRRIASGDLAEVALQAKDTVDRRGPAPVLLFDDTTGRLVEVNFRGTADDVRRRLMDTNKEVDTANSASETKEAVRGPGRPKLGVVAREVTLLPRHWDWLNGQPGGASVALRKLVEQARRVNEVKDRVRLSQEAANRFMSSLAGDLPGFEEATRALFAGNQERFDEMIEPWPADIREYAKKLAAAAMATNSQECLAEDVQCQDRTV
jgi:uncharacterized protein